MAQTPHVTGTDDSGSPGPGPRLMTSETLTGDPIRNRQGEELGSAKDFMLDMGRGSISYVVVAFGGFLGMGEKLFAVPWEALTLDIENKCFVLDVDKERLKDAPGFDKNDWPDTADPTWSAEIHNYYGTRPRSDDSLIR